MAERPIGDRTALAIALVTTAMLLFARATSDFWMDELLTISLFVQRPELSEVFSSYPIANNHILYSAAAWAWLKIAGPPALHYEFIMRLPSIAATLGGVAAIAIGARPVLGSSRASLAALMLGVCPAVQSLGWQVRGYGMTICLASMAAVGALLAARELKFTRRTGLWLLPPLILLPIVIPSNLVYNVAIVLALAILWWRRGRPRTGFPLLLTTAVAAVSGMLVYLPIRDQFMQVVRQTAGWDSGLAVAGHFLLAVLMLALPAGGILALARKLGGERDGSADPSPAIILAASGLVVCLAFALVKAPFPRTLAMFMPPVALAIASVLPSFDPKKLFKPILLVVAVGTLGAFIIMQVNASNRTSGVRSQNLITQFYTGSRMWSDALGRFANTEIPSSRPIVIVPFHDVLTAQWYWPDPIGTQMVNTSQRNGAYAFRPPVTALADRPFYILFPHGEDLVPACEELARSQLSTESLGYNGHIAVIKAQAKAPDGDFSPVRP